MADPIDAVITWVDGADPRHQQRLQAYLQALGGSRPVSADPTRFNNDGELEYCLTSIFRFAPWIRTIHVVTDQQVPPLLARLAGTVYADRVRVVDHREIFAGYESVLPTFNSRAIISMLWRVPGLAEQFLYFNDDFVLLQPIQPEDFFRDGKVVLRGTWQTPSQYRPIKRWLNALRGMIQRDPGKQRVRNLAAQELSAQLAGYVDRYLRLEHLPFPQRVSTLERFFAAHPEHLLHNISFRLRSGAQFKAEALALHLEARCYEAVFDHRLRTAQLKPSEQAAWRLRRKLQQADRSDRYAFACIQSLELAPPALHAEIVAWLDRRIGRLDSWLTGVASDAPSGPTG
ncbi:capsular biosynthesis protein [Ahniella affigens]|uniref:Capsular biosynthesis protein n=1 Tax=Ahniella affigens TaxID=2021234 RepID=A0A2P1PWC6_9GAMM|nr:stealth family protein [Ahniella affigens]AVP99139.1 capsular biosynthesis protein [Ahniella affigens]